MPSTVIRIVTINSSPAPARRTRALAPVNGLPGPWPALSSGHGQVCARCGASAATAPASARRAARRSPTLEGAERKLADDALRRHRRLHRARGGASTPRSCAAGWRRSSRSREPTIEEHGGTVEKYIGDAVMAVFGVPRAHGDDPDRAVAAGLALVAPRRGARDGLTVRVGVETGEVLALEPGGDLSVTGEAVNAAARLQQAAAPGEVLVGARAARACRAARARGPRPIEAKGFPAPLRAWRAGPRAPDQAA